MLSLLCTSAMAQTTTIFNEWQGTDFAPFTDHGVLYGLSSNGNYATGWGENTQLSILWSKDGNKLTDIYCPEEYEAETGHIEALGYDVSDKGTVVGSYWGLTYKDKAKRNCIYPGYRTIDGEWHDVELLSETVAGQGAAGAIMKVSKDDKVMGGHILNEDLTGTVPAIWIDGALQKPIVEISDCKYFRMTAMSEDGQIWAGIKGDKPAHMTTVYASYASIIYNKGKLVEIPFEGVPADPLTVRSYVSSISENGEYACGYCYYRTNDEENDLFTKGFIFKTSDNSFTWIEGMAPSVVTNDGTLFGRDIMDDVLGVDVKIAKAMIYKNGKLQELKEYLSMEHSFITNVVMSDVTGVSELQNNSYTIAGYTTEGGGMMGAERLCMPFVICITENGITNIGTTSENDQVKLTFFDSNVTVYGSFSDMSQNKRFLVGNISGNNAFVYDRVSGKLRKINGPDYTYGDATKQTCEGYGISNDGVISGAFVCKDSIDTYGDACSVAGIFRNGEWKALDRLPNVPLASNFFDGSAKAISADGTIIGGRVPVRPYKYNAVKWSAKGKIASLLEGCDEGSGGTVLDMSADGRVACGWIDDASTGYVAIWIGDEFISIGKKEDAQGRADCVSSNGKYVGGFYTIDPEKKPQGSAMIYNTETKEIKIISTHKEATGASVTGISDDGRIITGYSMFGSTTMRLPFIIIDGVFHDLDEYLKSLGWTAPEKYTDLSLFTPGGMSGDGTIIYGMADNGYRLPWVIEFKEAPKETKKVYAFMNFNDKEQSGWATFDLFSPSEVSIFKSDARIAMAGAYGQGEYYQILMGATPWAMQPSYPELVTVDLETGKSTVKGHVMANVLDMSYDLSSNIMYAIIFNDDMEQSLSTLDLSNGNITDVVKLNSEVSCVALACNKEGKLFTVCEDGNLYSIDKENGALNKIGSTGYESCDASSQTMEFDHDTDKLYWVAMTEGGAVTSFNEVDPSTGKATLISNFAQNDNLLGLYIPYSYDPTGIYDETYNEGNKANISLDSNEVDNFLHINGEYTSVNVYNVAGVCVVSDTKKSGSVNMGGLAKGIYYVKVMNGSQSASFKVIKK